MSPSPEASVAVKGAGPARRRRGDAFLTGRATYIADVRLDCTAHVAILRSAHAHARILSVDVSAALAHPGVVAAIDGREAVRHAGPLPHFVDPATFGGRTIEIRCLALDEVRYVGEPVAAVVAETIHDAEAALDLIEVAYDVLPANLDALQALAPEAAASVTAWPDNVMMQGAYEQGDPAGRIAAAPHRIDGEFHIQRCSTQPIETRGYVADWDARSERLTLHGSCQNPHPLRGVLAECLGLGEDQVRVIVPDVGGAFGIKMHGHPEEPLVCLLSRLVGRPVRWIEPRHDCLLIGGREQHHRFSAGFDGDGVVVGLRDEYVADVGALSAAPGWGMAYLTALTFPTGYRIADCEARFRIVATNKPPWNASRGYGKEQANLVMERVMDMVAERLGLHPAEVRRRNLIRSDEFPYRTSGGLNIDSGDYHAVLDQALELIDEPHQRERQKHALAAGRHLGIGIAFELTPEAGGTPGTLVGGFDSATVRVSPSGGITVLTGVTTPGGGNDTGIAQIVGGELGVDPESIVVVQGDTDRCPYGFGNFSGRSMVVGGSAAALAARDIAGRLRVLCARLLEAEPDDVVLAGGTATCATGSLSLRELVHHAYTDAFGVAAGIQVPLESTQTYRPDNLTFVPDAEGRVQTYPTYSNAVHACVVEVDPETGVVTIERYGVSHDCGTIINPTLVEGQMHGAVAMGIGAALSEVLLHDADGRLLTDGLKTYVMQRASDLPDIAIGHVVTPSPFTLLGVKGAGEAGVGGAMAAVTNAVADALRPLGAVIDELPLTPPAVLRAIAAGAA